MEQVPFDRVLQEQVKEIGFGQRAELFYPEEAGVESIQGIKDTKGSYTISVSHEAGKTTLSFLDELTHQKGTLGFTWPSAMSRFEVDTRDAPGGTGPRLYKEWRLTGSAFGSGIFAPGMGRGQKVTLIYQGRGNHCTEPTDFTHWTLVVHGKIATYHLFGPLKQGETLP